MYATENAPTTWFTIYFAYVIFYIISVFSVFEKKDESLVEIMSLA